MVGDVFSGCVVQTCRLVRSGFFALLVCMLLCMCFFLSFLSFSVAMLGLPAAASAVASAVAVCCCGTRKPVFSATATTVCSLSSFVSRASFSFFFISCPL
ncbi:hypothetical protein DFH11DRAFT_1617392, partial [Phellopilus nigrolimitatus]